jgi:hypothetical protein
MTHRAIAAARPAGGQPARRAARTALVARGGARDGRRVLGGERGSFTSAASAAAARLRAAVRTAVQRDQRGEFVAQS